MSKMADVDVHDLLRELLALPADFVFGEGMRPANVPGWDSVAWLELILALENRCGREVPIELFDGVLTVADVCRAVAAFANQGDE